MKANTLTSLLLTGAVLTCSQSVYAKFEGHHGNTHNEDALGVVDDMQDKLKQLKEMLMATGDVKDEVTTTEDDANSDINGTTVVGGSDVDEKDDEDEEKELLGADDNSVEADDNSLQVESIAIQSEHPKIHGLLKKYMESKENKELAADMEEKIKAEFYGDPKKACFETVEYFQNKKNPANVMKFGTVFNMMQMKKNGSTSIKDTLTGIQSGIQMRIENNMGVYVKQKVKFTPEMLCTK
ncbi:MAG: hypothetical protein COY39_01555 [Alphaproteobacteria bacterium CG_4_10_14_0_8_um_filter_37_21]|nr:MAG: hypothetical protein COY39_01555 [Alphaproteobacteria bacterium CG_4_10_14_0_8_um_filter_37_21]